MADNQLEEGSPVLPRPVSATVVEVKYEYELSDESENWHLWTYNIELRNSPNGYPVKILERHWNIEQEDGKISRPLVNGNTILGDNPILMPGQSLNYRSGVPLRGKSGSMRGYFVALPIIGAPIKIDCEEFKLECDRIAIGRVRKGRLSPSDSAVLCRQLEHFVSDLSNNGAAQMCVGKISDMSDEGKILLDQFIYFDKDASFTQNKMRNFDFSELMSDEFKLVPVIRSTDLFMRHMTAGGKPTAVVHARRSPDAVASRIELLLRSEGFEAEEAQAVAQALPLSFLFMEIPKEDRSAAFRFARRFLDRRTLPKVAPKLFDEWKADNPTGTIVDFLRRVWKRWAVDSHVLTREDLEEFDAEAARRLKMFLRGNRLPPDLVVKTIHEVSAERREDEAMLPPRERTARGRWALEQATHLKRVNQPKP